MTRSIVLAAWAVAALLLVSCEILSVATHRRYLGIRVLLQRMTSGRIRLSLAFIAWMWVGWHFFAR
jgi:hypothetical protein